jgi:DNA-binding PadR family transcriptional regulator
MKSMKVLDPIPSPSPEDGRTLSVTSFLILGMVRLGFSSGYAIRKAADQWTKTFWPISMSLVYPELARLEGLDLLLRHRDDRGARARAAYALTDEGEGVFLQWLGTPEIAPMRIRDEGMLRIFFADVLAIADQLELIDRIRENYRTKGKEMRGLASLAASPEFCAFRYPAVVAAIGQDTFAHTVRWWNRLERQIATSGTKQRGQHPGSRDDPSPPIGRMHEVIKLTPTHHLILAMVRFGANYGYAIRKAAAESTQGFWPTSFAQLYPQLNQMCSAGLLQRRSDPDGDRDRSAYELTDVGLSALCNWLRSPRLTPMQIRNEASLRLFFADALPRREQLALVRLYRQKQLRRSIGMRDQILPLGQLAEQQQGTRYPAILAHFGIDQFRYSARRLGRLEKELEAE